MFDLLSQLKNKGYSVGACVCNVSKIEDLTRMLGLALEFFGGNGIDGIVGNAGVNPLASSTLEAPDSVYEKVMDVNVKSYWNLIKLASPHLNINASIVFVSSIGGFQPSPPAGLYGVSKMAVVALGRALSQDLGTKGIRVNCIAPGLVKTRMSAYFWSQEGNEELAKAQADATALKRLGDPENIAAIAAFLLSPDASFVTGETILATGGLNSRL